MSSKQEDSAEPQSPPIDWIVVGANMLCLVIVALAALHAGALGLVPDTANYASVTTNF